MMEASKVTMAFFLPSLFGGKKAMLIRQFLNPISKQVVDWVLHNKNGTKILDECRGRTEDGDEMASRPS